MRPVWLRPKYLIVFNLINLNLHSSMIAYGEWCQIPDLQRSFNFGTRDQAWSLKSFCVAVLLKRKREEKTSDIDIRRGIGSAPFASVSKGVKYFLNWLLQ